MRKQYLRFLAIVIVNCIVFLILFVAAEISYRVYSLGFTKAIKSLEKFYSDVPYSNLGVSNWVIFDKELGYRLNPREKNFNNLSVRHGKIAIPKPNKIHRIMFLGDSVTWDKVGFVKHTRDILKKKGQFEIINAAVPGYTSYQEVLFYNKYLHVTTPDLVIWVYCLNDNHKFLHRFDEKANMLMTEEARKTLRINSFWDRIVSRSYILTRLHLGIISRINLKKSSNYNFGWESSVDFNNAWKDHAWKDYESHLIKLQSILDNQNAKMAIIVFPIELQLLYRNDEENYNYVVKPQRKIRALCKKYDVLCLDLYQKFADEYSRNRRLYRDGIHLNSYGHKLTTKLILAFLIENSLIALE
jgi:lysophospholipase L1-like esterase